MLLPVLTRFLSPSDYGTVATFQILLAVSIVFIGLNFHGAVGVNFFKMEKEKLKIYSGNVILLLLTNFIMVFFLLLVFKPLISRWVTFPESWLPVVAVIALAQSLCTLLLTIWQVENRALSYGLFQILQTVINVCASLFFVVVLGWKWQGRLTGIIVASTCFACISTIVLKKKYVTFHFHKSYAKDALYYGIPLIPHALGAWIITSIDRIFINSMVGLSATGLYVVGYQIGMIIEFFAQSFNTAWSPFLFEKLREGRMSAKVRIVKFTYVYFIAIVVMAGILSFVSPYFLKYFVSKSFFSSYQYVIWIALGYAASGMYYMVVNYIFFVKKTYLLAWVTFFTACVNALLNYFLIRCNGAVGAAQATTISFFLTFVLVWALSAKVYKMPWLSFWKISEKQAVKE